MNSTAWTLSGCLAATVLLASSAIAHHGWSWAEDEQSELRGTITDVYIGPPHPRLQVETEEGEWRIDLGNPTRTRNAGFVQGEAEEGDEVVLIGHRSADGDEKYFKAVRATINGQNYDFYPERIQETAQAGSQ